MTRYCANVLLAPLVSEKVTRSGERENSVTFWVNPKASKQAIKKAVETFFPHVKVEAVHTSIKRRSSVKFGASQGFIKKKKKAYVTLAQGHQINLAELED